VKKSISIITLVLFTALAGTACKKKAADSSAAPATGSAAMTASGSAAGSAMAAAPTTPPAPKAPPAVDVPTAQDFEEQAKTQIDEKNVDQQLQALEKDLGK